MGSTQICLNVRIIDDELSNEPDEEFSVFLLDADPSSGFGLNESCITILDDDGKSDMSH